MVNDVINFIETSFLSDILKKESVTDISFNGDDLFYQDNELGRIKSTIKVTKKEVSDFIRQIANLCEKQFSYSEPILDLNVGKYRINAVHGAICFKNYEHSISFSIRIASLKSKIDGNLDFCNIECFDLLSRILNAKKSIVISGKTSCGKTELQRYLLLKIPKNSRVIIIDNINELNVKNSNIDLTIWQVNNLINNASFDSLISNALRNNPDWLIVAETRNDEMASVINSASSGHPIIFTVHSDDIYALPDRLTRLALLNKRNVDYKTTLLEVCDYFPIFIMLKSKIDESGKIKRFIDQIAEQKNGKLTIIYSSADGFLLSGMSTELKKDLHYE